MKNDFKIELVKFLYQEQEYLKQELAKDYSDENILRFEGRSDELNIIIDEFNLEDHISQLKSQN